MMDASDGAMNECQWNSRNCVRKPETSGKSGTVAAAQPDAKISLPVEAESKTLVREAQGAPLAKHAQNLLAHQTAPRRGCAGLGIVTCGVADAAEAAPTTDLGLRSVGANFQAIYLPGGSGNTLYSL